MKRFLDVAGSAALFGSAETIGRAIQAAIAAELQLDASVGVAPNKFVAKIASDLHKPRGFVAVAADDVLAFLAPLPVQRLWGVGKKTQRVFEKLGIRTLGQLRAWPVDVLRERFGTQGEHFWRLAHGRDPREVVPDRAARSISHETTFAHDIAEPAAQSGVLFELADQVGRRLRRAHRRAAVVHLKLRYPDFRTLTRSLKLNQPTQQTQTLWQTAKHLLQKTLPKPQPLRLLGVGVTDIRDAEQDIQRTLFEIQDTRQQSALDQVSDAIKAKFGAKAIRRGEG